MGVARPTGHHPPRRGGRRGVVVLLVLALVGTFGAVVAATAPTLVAGLGMVEPTPAPAPPVPQPVLGPLAANSPQPTAVGLALALDGVADTVPGTLAGTVVDPGTGAVLWGRNPEQALVPGSAGKLLTAAAALLTLDPAARFVTRVVATPDPGTVVLVGGGDPTLTRLPDGENGVYPGAPRLAELAAQVTAVAPGPVTRVLVDTTRFGGSDLATGWFTADIAGGYVAPIAPLMLDGGRIDPALPDGPRVADPAETAGRALAELLGADQGTVAPGTAPPEAEAPTLGTVASAPMTDLVEHLLRSSDNVLAEALAREVAVARGGQPTFEGAAEQTMAALSQAGFDVGGAVLVDGSGLSTEDRIPARLLGSLLAAAAAPAQEVPGSESLPGSASLRPILTGLPVAGGDGTLDDRFGLDGASAPGRGVVRAKTGTLTSVSSLAGVVTDADGRLLVFALISNGASPTAVRPRLDAVATELSRCGCR